MKNFLNGMFNREKTNNEKELKPFKREDRSKFINGKEVTLMIGDKEYEISLLKTEPSVPLSRTALLSDECGVVLGELDVNLSSGHRSFGHLSNRGTGALYKVLDYLNAEQAEFLHYLEIKKTKENTETSIKETLENE